MASSDSMVRAAERIAIDYPVQILKQPTGKKTVKGQPKRTPPAVAAAAGIDTHPGGEELKHYWLEGPGAAKWSTWTELFEHLRHGKGLSAAFAKRIAAAWFHERYGYWPGDHRNLHASADVLDEEADEWEEAIAVLVAALAELSGGVLAAFEPGKHPRGAGGKFRSTVDKLKDAIKTHRSSGGKGDPFEGYDREQLRRAAVKRPGITLTRGESRDSIAKKLLDDLHKDEPADEPKPAVAPKKAPAKRAPRKKAAPRHESDLPGVGRADTSDPRFAALSYRTGKAQRGTLNEIGYVKLNNHLRYPHPFLDDPEMDAKVRDIDSVLAEHRTTQSITLYRGVSDPAKSIGVDKAYPSATTDPAHAATFGGTLLRLTVHPGVGAVHLPDHDPAHPEHEILLDRGLEQVETGRSTITMPDGTRREVIDVEVRPKATPVKPAPRKRAPAARKNPPTDAPKPSGRTAGRDLIAAGAGADPAAVDVHVAELAADPLQPE